MHYKLTAVILQHGLFREWISRTEVIDYIY